jgi:succinate-semialdehyde dehydrogenase / glutarate-semialdehyde dehydrogenase
MPFDLAATRKELHIGGVWLPAADDSRIDVIDPATEQTIASVADAGVEDALAAVDAAARAGPAWAARSPRERGEILRRSFELMLEQKEAIARLITLESGKALAEARAEVAYAAEFLRWYSEEAARILGEIGAAPSGSNRMIVLRQPVGVCLFITPWNFPAAMATRKIGPALAAGCTIVLKPAKETPLTALAMASIFQEAGVPSGVVNVIPSRRSSVAKLRNGGESCTAANRFYVEAPVAAEFAKRLADAMARIKVGPGLDEGVQMGPLVNEATRRKVAELVTDARNRGGRVLTGGKIPHRPGFYYEPTVIADLPTDARVFHEEIFGPVAPIASFRTEAEAIALANDTEFGLVSFVHTRDLAKALRVAERIESGMVGINRGVVSDPAAPFGGWKQSGLGREGAHAGLLEYLESKYIAASW